MPFKALTRKRGSPCTEQQGAPQRGATVPSGFDAISEAVAAGADVEGPCVVAGQRLAEAGVDLEELLDGLAVTYARAGHAEPAFAAVRALVCGWADSSLQYFHGLSCEDPLTGLATIAHARTRLSELYRRADCTGRQVSGTHALLVVELVGAPPDDPGDRLERSLKLVEVVDALRAVYPTGEPVARAGARRALTVVRRTRRLGEQVAVLRQCLADWSSDAQDHRSWSHRVWIEGLPADDGTAGLLLDELAR
jgi:hypothetical protein